MRVLRKGDRGPEVRQWQFFLVGQGFDVGTADGIFGEQTLLATVAFQQRHGLVPDGVVANRTLGEAARLGFEIAADPAPGTDANGANFPPPPPFPALTGTAERQRLFGKFAFRPRPLPGNRENIEITDDFVQRNIQAVPIPQLAGIRGAPASRRMEFHRLAAAQLQALWAEWETAGLLDRVLTFDGSFSPRFVRGRIGVLSNHAFGSAFDINEPFNPIGTVPALVGKRGSVRELVEIANRHGFFWGGHFKGRKDGMHFEVAKLL